MSRQGQAPRPRIVRRQLIRPIYVPLHVEPRAPINREMASHQRAARAMELARQIRAAVLAARITPDPELVSPAAQHAPGKCRVCGCTDADCRGCVEATGAPCYWVDPSHTLCSACAPPTAQR